MKDPARETTPRMTPGTPDESGHNFELILLGLLALLLMGPLLSTVAPGWHAPVMWVTVGAAVAAGVSGLVESAAYRVAGCLAGALLASAGLLGSGFGVLALQVATAVGVLGFCLWAIAMSLRQVLLGPRVDLNRLTGAVVVYMLMGIAWAIAYLLIALAVTGSFRGLSGADFDTLWPQLLYYSFVTLTTLGYGDISPAVPLAQSLAYLEALIGQLYIAILIAGLLGAHLSTRER